MEGESYRDYGTSTENILNSPSEDVYDENQELQPKKKGHFIIRFLPVIFFVISFYCSAIGSFTIFPQYILSRLKDERNFSELLGNTSLNPCQVNKSDHVYQVYLEIQQKSSHFLSSAGFAGGLPSLVSVVIFGALSDKLGRKKIIYISYAGLLVLSIGLSLLISMDLPLWTFFIFSFLNGCCGSHGTMLAAIFAHVADVTNERQRALVIAIVEFSLGLSMIITNVILGAIIDTFGFKVPIIGLSILAVLSILFVICVKETVPNMEDSMSTCQLIRAPFSRIKMLLEQNRRRSISVVLLTITFMLHSLIITSGFGVSTLYLMGSPFCWDSFEFGVFNGLKVTSHMIFSFTVIVLCRHRFNNDNLILVGLVSFFGANLFTAMASGFSKPACNAFIFSSIAVGIFTSLPGILIRSQSSKIVRPDEQGAVFGLLSTGETLAFSFGSTISNAIYGASVSFLAGLIYYFSSFLVLISFVLIVIYKVIAAPLRRSLATSVNSIE